MRGIPVWISWLKYVSFIYWGWNLLLKVREQRYRGIGASRVHLCRRVHKHGRSDARSWAAAPWHVTLGTACPRPAYAPLARRPSAAWASLL